MESLKMKLVLSNDPITRKQHYLRGDSANNTNDPEEFLFVCPNNVQSLGYNRNWIGIRLPLSYALLKSGEWALH